MPSLLLPHLPVILTPCQLSNDSSLSTWKVVLAGDGGNFDEERKLNRGRMSGRDWRKMVAKHRDKALPMDLSQGKSESQRFYNTCIF